jgi:hypothetical protein
LQFGHLNGEAGTLYDMRRSLVVETSQATGKKKAPVLRHRGLAVRPYWYPYALATGVAIFIVLLVANLGTLIGQ